MGKIARFFFCLPVLGCAFASAVNAAARFEIFFPASVRANAADGRVLLIISKKSDREPRFQVSQRPDSQQIFGVDVESLAPGKSAVIDGGTLGYPVPSLMDVQDGAAGSGRHELALLTAF